MRRFECNLCREDEFSRPCVLVVSGADDKPDVCPWSWSGLENTGQQADWVEICRKEKSE